MPGHPPFQLSVAFAVLFGPVGPYGLLHRKPGDAAQFEGLFGG